MTTKTKLVITLPFEAAAKVQDAWDSQHPDILVFAKEFGIEDIKTTYVLEPKIGLSGIAPDLKAEMEAELPERTKPISEAQAMLDSIGETLGCDFEFANDGPPSGTEAFES